MSIAPLFIANWKMHKLQSEARAFCKKFRENFEPLADGSIDAGIAPAFTSTQVVIEALQGQAGVFVGSQNVHWLSTGAHTGEVSAEMQRELGLQFVIVGHSERRQFYGETDEFVSLRAQAAIAQKMLAVVCVGETKEEFEIGETKSVVTQQLLGSTYGIADPSNLLIAYEPVWAIGTGLAATPEIAAGVHKLIREELNAKYGLEQGSKIRILYGGSTKPENIAELIVKDNIDGALIGGASLEVDSFCQLIKNARSACQ